MRQLTSIDLLYLRQRQPHFIPVHDVAACLQRVPLEIYRVQTLDRSEFALHLLEACEEVAARPQLFQVLQMGHVLEVADLIV